MAAEKPQQGDPQTFDAGRFGRWLRMMLVSFYTDEEAVVADALYRKASMIKDAALARLLCLPERQVRQALELRLVPDCIVDKCSEGTGDKLQTFYRISPVAVAVAAKRLQLLETSLAAKNEERYLCSECNRYYDALKAMSQSFACECGKALSSSAEDAATQRDRLQRFRMQCKDLLQLTQELENLPGPQFGHPPKVRKPRGSAKAQAQEKGQSAASPEDAQPLQPDREQSAKPAVLWPDAPQGPFVEQARTVEEEVSSAQNTRPRASLEERLRGSAKRDHVEVVQEDPYVLAGGQPHRLSQAFASEELQERMTDEEYQRFFDAHREVQQRKLRSMLL